MAKVARFGLFNDVFVGQSGTFWAFNNVFDGQSGTFWAFKLMLKCKPTLLSIC